jgi:pyruvate/2-oxoglutarate dehydrogenase complex dihydrolipoamide acyltransferase (E2) component
MKGKMETSTTLINTIPFDLQRNMVAHMTTNSWKAIPHVSYLYEPDVTGFLDEYKSLSEDFTQRGLRVSFNTLMIRTIVEGVKVAPEMNALLDYNHLRGTGKLKVSKTVNMAMAWTLPDKRMITPVLFDISEKSLAALCCQVRDLDLRISRTNIDELIYDAVKNDTLEEIKKLNPAILCRLLAHLGKLKHLTGQEKRDYCHIPSDERLNAHDLLDATITVSNIGSLYKGQRGVFGFLEVIPPQVAVIGIGAIQDKPGLFINQEGNQEIGIRKILPLNLVFDHRAFDFNALVPFIQRLDEIFANPEVIHTW